MNLKAMLPNTGYTRVQFCRFQTMVGKLNLFSENRRWINGADFIIMAIVKVVRIARNCERVMLTLCLKNILRHYEDIFRCLLSKSSI